MMKDKMILTGLFVLLFSMALLGGCGTTNESTEGNKVESNSQLPGDGNSELYETETGTEEVSETETKLDTETEIDTEIESETETETEMETETQTESETEGAEVSDNSSSNSSNGGNTTSSNTTTENNNSSTGNSTGGNIGKVDVSDIVLADGERLMYAISAVYVRSYKSTDSDILGTLSAGEAVVVIGKSYSGWEKIKYGNGYGYVATKFLEGDEEEAQIPEIVYALEDTTVYGTNNIGGCICGTLLKDQGVIVVGRSSDGTWSEYDTEGEWYQVRFGGAFGFIPAKYMTETGNGEVAETKMIPQTSKEAFDLINAERIALGLEPAVWDEECERIALIRAQELHDLGYITSENAHAGFDKFWEEDIFLCECVAWGFGAPVGAVNGWMNSDGHRDALMRENRVKLAVAYCGDKWVAINNIDLEDFN